MTIKQQAAGVAGESSSARIGGAALAGRSCWSGASLRRAPGVSSPRGSNSGGLACSGKGRCTRRETPARCALWLGGPLPAPAPAAPVIKACPGRAKDGRRLT